MQLKWILITLYLFFISGKSIKLGLMFTVCWPFHLVMTALPPAYTTWNLSLFHFLFKFIKSWSSALFCCVILIIFSVSCLLLFKTQIAWLLPLFEIVILTLINDRLNKAKVRQIMLFQKCGFVLFWKEKKIFLMFFWTAVVKSKTIVL